MRVYSSCSIQSISLFWYKKQHINNNPRVDDKQICKTMRNHYNFNEQVAFMNEICQTNIYFAEVANKYLRSMPLFLILRAVKELKEEYEDMYIRTDEEQLTTIFSTLNIIKKEQATNIDELFMGLGFEINAYYGAKHFNLKKREPYLKKCRICKRQVSNYAFGLKFHETKCLRRAAEKNGVIEKKKRLTDTFERYERRQDWLRQQFSKMEKGEERQWKLSKKERLAVKKNLKKDALASNVGRRIEQNEFYDGEMNFNHLDDNMFYFEDNDAGLVKKGEEKLKREEKTQDCLPNLQEIEAIEIDQEKEAHEDQSIKLYDFLD